MAIRNYSNTTTTGALTAPVTSGATFMTVTSFSNMPAVPFTITVERGQPGEELCLVTAVDTNTSTVTRGYNGTAAQAHAAASTVEHTVIAMDFSEANTHVNATENIHGVTGGLVGDEQAQTLLDKTLISPVVEADATAGDAIVAYVPVGAEVRNLFRGMNPDGDDVITIDSSGRVTGALATAPEHLARKSQVDAVGTRVTALETPVNARTAAATASTIMTRDSSGNTAVDAVTLTDAPTVAGHATRKDYVDGQVAAVGTTAATANTVAKRDANGRLAVATPSASGDAATKGYVDSADAALDTRVDTLEADTGWQNLTPLNSFSTSSGGWLAYRVVGKTATIRVNLARAGTGSGVQIASLPAEARPSVSLYAIGMHTTTPVPVLVAADGSMTTANSTSVNGVVVTASWPVG